MKFELLGFQVSLKVKIKLAGKTQCFLSTRK